MLTIAPAHSHRAILANISWHTFETILTEMGNHRATRLAYNQGTLEIMTPLMPHEHNNRLLQNLIIVLVDLLLYIILIYIIS
jgi:Uma2 family endonuclease